MADLYNLADIDLGSPTHFGHEAYLDAVYYPPETKEKPSKIILKKNKSNKAKFSRLEVAFSQLARLFLAKGTTAHQKLVVNESNKVVGLVTEHLCYVIGKKEGIDQSFFTLDNPQINCNYTRQHVEHVEKIPYYFFDKLPQDFFAQLLKTESEQALSIDYASLASILASSYTLEEDDLHKGNFGFYLIEKEGKPQVVFFKIDHDLMFADSIMSFNAARLGHLMHGSHAFDISAEDLLRFPCLKNSTNFYWPTKIDYLFNPLSYNKGYHNSKEVEAFSLLAEVPEFKKAKWMAFYKHILLPAELIAGSLRECLDKNTAHERAQIALIVQATVARQARLKSMLFSIKEFRDFVGGLTPNEHESLLKEVVESSSAVEISAQVTKTISSYENLCHCPHGFEEGDTPLHTAIKLGDYRYEETIQMFGQFINTKNKAGKTPLDVALDRCRITDKDKHTTDATDMDTDIDIRKDVRFTMKHLLANGANISQEFKQFNLDAKIESYQFQTPYLKLVTEAKSYQQVKDILRDIGEDNSLCLKSKKNLAIECIAQLIKVNQNHPNLHAILIKLKKDMNGDSTKEECAGIKYIRQLRSRLWIIRHIRGPYGRTSTQDEVNEMLDKELRRTNKVKESNFFSFFSADEAPELENNDSSTLQLI